MINFVIYEDKKQIRDIYVNIIHKFMGDNDTLYNIVQFSCYDNKLENFIQNNIGHNVYLLDIEIPGKSGLDLAREIRITGDMESQLIIVTAHKEMLDNTYVNKSLILNFVSKYDDCETNLLKALQDAFENITKYKSYVFKYEGELYKIPYNDILNFETDSHEGYVKIITKTKEYPIKKTIISIEKELNDPRFMKTHKSCIVNLFNVEHVDLVNLIIYFYGGKETLLLSRNYKKELQERLYKL